MVRSTDTCHYNVSTFRFLSHSLIVAFSHSRPRCISRFIPFHCSCHLLPCFVPPCASLCSRTLGRIFSSSPLVPLHLRDGTASIPSAYTGVLVVRHAASFTMCYYVCTMARVAALGTWTRRGPVIANAWARYYDVQLPPTSQSAQQFTLAEIVGDSQCCTVILLLRSSLPPVKLTREPELSHMAIFYLGYARLGNSSTLRIGFKFAPGRIQTQQALAL